MRKKYSESFKFKVALTAVKGEMTIAEICQRYEVAASQVHQWKKQLLENGASLFNTTRGRKPKVSDPKETDRLYKKIGQLTVERDFLKKSWESYDGEND